MLILIFSLILVPLVSAVTVEKESFLKIKQYNGLEKYLLDYVFSDVNETHIFIQLDINVDRWNWLNDAVDNPTLAKCEQVETIVRESFLTFDCSNSNHRQMLLNKLTNFRDSGFKLIRQGKNSEYYSRVGDIINITIPVSEHRNLDYIHIGEDSIHYEFYDERIVAKDDNGFTIGILTLNTDNHSYLNNKPHISTGYGNDILIHTFEINNYSVDAITDLKATSLKNGEEVERNVRIKYLDHYNETLEVCTNSVNYVCLEYQNQTFVREVWNELNSSLTGQNLIIGFFADTIEGDYIDIDFKYYGVSVADTPFNMASWDSSLNTNIVNYWKLDDGNVTNVVDELGNADGTKLSTQPVGASGKINGAYYFSGTQTINHTNTYSDINIRTSPLSINLWVYFTSADNYANFYSSGLDGAGGWGLVTRETDIVQVTKPGVNVDGCATGTNAILKNSWSMLTMVSWGNGTNEIWINGSRICTGTLTLDYNSGSSVAFIGSHAVNQTTKIDEVAIWTRGLTGTEITTLYASSDGMSYEGDADPTVELGTPANETEYNSNSISVDFTCKGIDDINLDNLTFYLWNMSTGGLINSQTNTDGQNDTLETFSYTVTGGTNYSWNCLATDNSSNSAYATNNNTIFVYSIPDMAPHINNSPHNPSGNYLTSGLTYVFNFTEVYDDIKVDNVSLYINSLVNQTNTSGANNTNYIFSLVLGDGFYSYYGKVTDNASQQSTTSTQNFTVDSIDPEVTITSPVDYFNVTQYNQSINLNWTITDANLDTCWYRADELNYTMPGSEFNDSITVISGNYNFTTNVVGGSYGHFLMVNTAVRTITQTVNTTASWTAPQDTANCFNPTYTNESIITTSNIGKYVCFDLNNGRKTVILITGSGAFNWGYYEPKFVVECSTNYTTFNYPITNPDSMFIELYANDTVGHISSDNVTILKSTTEPVITIYSPVSSYALLHTGDVIDIDFSILNVTILDSCWYSYLGVNTTINCTENTSFSYNGGNSLTIFANDTLGNINSTTVNWTVYLYEGAYSFDDIIYEGEQNDVSIDVVLAQGVGITEAYFNYNGTNYSTNIAYSAGNNYTISASITTPLVDYDQNVSLFFYITVAGATSTTTAQNQTIKNVNFSVCGGISSDLLINMSLFDEDTGANLAGNIEVYSTVTSKTSGLLIEELNSTFSTVHSGALCFSPTDAYDLYYYGSEIRYSATGYQSELYFIQRADMGDYPVNLSLYDLNSNESTKFTLKYQDENLVTVEGAVIQLVRRYTGTDENKVVEAPLTSNIGTAIVSINLDSYIYQAYVVKDGEFLDFFDNIVFDCENELTGECTQNLFSKVNPQNSISEETLDDFSFYIEDNQTSSTLTTNFVTPSGTPQLINIVMYQEDVYGNTSLCNTTILSSSGAIDCTYETTFSDSVIHLKVYKAGEFKGEKQFLVLQDTDYGYGGLNFLIVVILLLSLVGMAITSPEFMIINGAIAFILAGGIWLLNGMSIIIGLAGLIYLIIAIALIIYKMAMQEDR